VISFVGNFSSVRRKIATSCPSYFFDPRRRCLLLGLPLRYYIYHAVLTKPGPSKPGPTKPGTTKSGHSDIGLSLGNKVKHTVRVRNYD